MARQTDQSNGKKSERDHLDAALVAVLMPLSKILIRGGFGVGELVRAAKISFVHAAIKEIAPAGRKINVSRLSVITGLTRKEISAVLLRRVMSSKPQNAGRLMEHRAVRVLRGWRADPGFQLAGGRPATLSLRGNGRSFSVLVKLYGGDVTPASVLHELKRIGAVTLSPSGKLRLQPSLTVPRDYIRRRISMFGRLVGDFSEAAQKVVLNTDESSFLGFMDSKMESPNQAALFQRVFSKRAVVLLQSADQWMKKHNELRQGRGAARRNVKGSRIGIGIYLIGDEKGRQKKHGK